MAAPGGAGHLHDLTDAEVDAVAEMNQIELQEFRFAEIYKEIKQEFKDAKSRITKYNTTDGIALDIVQDQYLHQIEVVQIVLLIQLIVV